MTSSIEPLASAPVTPPRKLLDLAPAPQERSAPDAADTHSAGRSGDPVLVQGRFAVLNARKEMINQAVNESQATGEARRLINQARQELEGIVKSFPPFPPNSVEREQYLNSVAGIRAVIQQLTFPPEVGRVLEGALSGDAFTDTGASVEQLQAGLTVLGDAEAALAATQSRLGDGLALVGGSGGNEAFYLAQSKQVGRELLRQNASISQNPQAMRGLLA